MFRLTLHLHPLENGSSIPFSCNQILANEIHKTLSRQTPFIDPFSVSNLFFTSKTLQGNRIHPIGPISVVLTAMTTLSIEYVQSLLLHQEFSIGDAISHITYHVTEINIHPDIHIDASKPVMYSSLSSICVRIPNNDDTTDYFLLPGHRLFNDYFFEHAYQKHFQLSGKRLDLSKAYYREAGPLLNKTVQIEKQNGTVTLRCFQQPFALFAPLEIHQVLLYAGAGDLNHLGLGAVKIATKKDIVNPAQHLTKSASPTL